MGRGASAEGRSRRTAGSRMSDAPARGTAALGAASGKGLAREAPARKGKGMTVREAVCAPDAGGQPPTPAVDPYKSAIDGLFWGEREAARRDDYSAAREAAIKKVILQEARALLLAGRFV